MNANKLTHVHVYIIGVVLALLVGGGLYFALLKPLYEQNAALRGQISTKESTQVQIDTANFTIAQIQDAEKALEAVRKRKSESEAKLAAMERRKQLPDSEKIDIGNGTEQELLTRTMPNWLKLPRVVVTRMEKFSNAMAKRYGVDVQGKFAAPAPATNPKAIPNTVIAWTLGNLSVTGEFNRVMDWVKSWNNAPLLTMVDNVKCSLAGPGGKVNATATITVFIFPTGKAVQIPGAGQGAMTGGADPYGMGGAMGGAESPYGDPSMMGTPGGEMSGNGPGDTGAMGGE